ncbi:MAG: LysR substrate-binding domain-containing protein [Acidimicrobiales bacterium]
MTDYDRDLPPLATLVAFEAAYRHRNFTRAAQELFQSQTTVSRRVRELEADLGVALFDRQRYDAIPTRHGDELIGSVRLALGELSATATRIRDRGDADALVVLSSLTLTTALVLPAVSQFQREHPSVDVRVISACSPIETSREHFDIAIQYGPRHSARFGVHVIADEAVFPVSSPGFAEQLPNPVTVADLARLPLVDVAYDDPSWITWADFFTAHHSRPDTVSPQLTVTSYEASLDSAELGETIALGWERSVRGRIEAGTLVEIPGHRSPGATINAYVPRPSTAYASQLVDLIQQHQAANPQNP